MSDVEDFADPSTMVSQVLHRVLQDISSAATAPSATYRFQMRKEFDFDAAAAQIPYINRLGVSYAYCSPYLKATPGSAHGYDTVDYTQINPELGGREARDRFAAKLAEHGMSHLLDIVPNHMGVDSSENHWWRDVLENGPSSPYSHYFDIDWRPSKSDLRNKVLLPILGDQYGKVLEGGHLKIDFDAGAFVLHVYDRKLPLAGRTYDVVLDDVLERVLQHALDGYGAGGRTPTEIHALGLAEVERVSARMNEIMDGLDATKDVSGTAGERFATLADDPTMVYPNTDAAKEALLASLREQTAAIQERAPDWFGTLPPPGRRGARASRSTSRTPRRAATTRGPVLGRRAARASTGSTSRTRPTGRATRSRR